MNLRIAVKEDCPRLLDLVHELALFEKAPEEVTEHSMSSKKQASETNQYGKHLLLNQVG